MRKLKPLEEYPLASSDQGMNQNEQVNDIGKMVDKVQTKEDIDKALDGLHSALDELVKCTTILQEMNSSLAPLCNQILSAVSEMNKTLASAKGSIITLKVSSDSMKDLELANDDLMKLEYKALNDHAIAFKEIFQEQYHEMANMISRNHGLWISTRLSWWLVGVGTACTIYVIISIIMWVAII